MQCVQRYNPLTQPSYEYPPITEAVIEFRFEQELSAKQIEAAAKKFKPLYPNQTEVHRQQFKISAGSTDVESILEEPQHRFGNDEETRVILLSETSVTISQLAPYGGWDSLRSDAWDAWHLLKKISGFRTLTRYGVRYINRLDLAYSDNGTIPFEDYLTLHIALPDNFYDLTAYQMNFRFNMHDLRASGTVTSRVAEGIILDHGSFYLDIDVASQFELPQKADELFDLLDRVRIRKNELFEGFITDKAREIFNAK